MRFNPYTHSEAALNERIAQIIDIETKKGSLKEALKTIFQSIDFTTLEAFDNAEKIDDFCAKALAFKQQKPHLSVPAICIYSPFVRQAKQLLKGSGIRVATVACCFPSGQMPFDLKLKEVEYCVNEGADDVDMVISRGTFLAGRYDEVFDEIQAVKQRCGNQALLKVILETGELKTVENIRKASELAILAGADFIKTSTGKVPVAATPLAAIVMIDTIKEYYEATGKKVGFKPAGGMKTPEDALTYYYLVKHILGEQWLNPSLFRVGTSRLAGLILEEINR
ncbi:MAG: deoxyribose-phosphate aldolase [Bacteroidales bacterium]|nr:deoxyribose-phosphate aldolase [Bacteroidales bacterium]